MSRGIYIFERRPPDVSHKHPYLVFDCHGRLDVPLTAITKKISEGYPESTTRTYLHALMPFFTYLATDEWQIRAGRTWTSPPDQVQQAVYDYLVGHLQCKVRGRGHFQLISLTQETRSTIRVFLSALKRIYKVARRLEYYTYDNPMIDTFTLESQQSDEGYLNEEGYPRMPQVSGVETPRRQPRLTDSYFKLENEEWVPQTINDPEFPNHVLRGGKRLPGWGLREECVTMLLFDTGARISEICGLTLGDWEARGTLTEANAFNKGSNKKRVKFIRFTKATARLLRKYFDEERAALDEHNYTLNDYRRASRNGHIDIHRVPLFLSHQRTQLSPKTFRDNYWNPACRAAGIDADIHQARHWYVTNYIKTIYESVKTEEEREVEKGRLIKDMHWADGERTMKAYLHLWRAADHARVQDRLHKRLTSLRRMISEEPEKHRRGRPRKAAGPVAHPKQPSWATTPDRTEAEEVDSDIEFLRRLGGRSGR